MSLYKKAWLFLIVASVLVLTSPDWTAGTGHGIAAVVLVVGALMSMFAFVCPNCSFSLFRSESIFGIYVYHPWPNKRCSRCGRDHSALERH